MLSFLRTTSPTRLAIFLILAVVGYRFWFATQIGLVADEAYYWLWSKHLAASYRDKGPAIAWTIALGTRMFGDTVFGIRFFAVLLSGGVGWLIFVLARRLYDERTALWCLLVAFVMPILAVGSILMTIDSLSVFFWALAVLIFWNALHNGRTSAGSGWGWPSAPGSSPNLPTACNWSASPVFCCGRRNIVRCCSAAKPWSWSRRFASPARPILWWNIQTGWVHAMALHARSGVTDSFHIRPSQTLRFLGEQFGVMSPLFGVGILVAAGDCC